MKIEKRTITPFEATKILKGNDTNRRVSEPTLLRYTSDILAGKWKEDTGELIKISETGKLLDGQHRLMAIVKANITLKLWVATGISDDAFDVIDTGKPRSATDVFYIKGVKSAKTVPSIIALYKILENGYSGKNGVQKHLRCTNQELLSIYNDDVEFWAKVTNNTLAWYGKFARILSPSTIGALYTLFSKINGIDALDFFEQVSTGENISNRAIALLRTRLIADKTSNSSRLSQSYKHALIIKAWNHFRSGDKNVKQLKFTPSSESFPTPI